MTERKSQPEVEDVLSSIRRLVGHNNNSEYPGKKNGEVDQFVLTHQLRVSPQDVLRLKPDDEVQPDEAWQEYEEPPLTASEPAEAQPNATSENSKPYLLVHPLNADRVSPRSKHKSDDKPAAHVSVDRTDLGAKIAALEAAIAKTADHWEPDGASLDAYSGTESPAIDWKDDVDLDATGHPAEVNGTDTDAAPEHKAITVHAAERGDLEEQVIDEAMLQSIVADIVRSELQGELGERMTRNIRKMVRREIYRAMTAKSFG